MKAIVTVVGKDRVGIIASVSVKLAELGINVLDISQTILQDYFTMVMSVDLAGCESSFGEVKEILSALGDSMGVIIRIQRTEIFDAMYKI